MMERYKNLRENNLHQTEQILNDGNLLVHQSVGRISLEGSRGLKGGFREDSDLDMSLILEPGLNPTEEICEDVINYSLQYWKSNVELDLAVVFDKKNCGLECFDRNNYKSDLCDYGTDCVGIYKNQKGFSGFIEDIGLEVKLMYPLVIIWDRNG